jgi:hypothetical protein
MRLYRGRRQCKTGEWIQKGKIYEGNRTGEEWIRGRERMEIERKKVRVY